MIKAECIEKRIELIVSGYKKEIFEAVKTATKADCNFLLGEIETAVDKGYISFADYGTLYGLLTNVNCN